MKEIDFKESLSSFHNMPESDVKDLSSHISNLLASEIRSSMTDGDNEVKIDLGFGSLIVQCNTSEGYTSQFSLDDEFLMKLQDKENPLILELKQRTQNKLNNLYRKILS